VVPVWLEVLDGLVELWLEVLDGLVDEVWSVELVELLELGLVLCELELLELGLVLCELELLELGVVLGLAEFCGVVSGMVDGVLVGSPVREVEVVEGEVDDDGEVVDCDEDCDVDDCAAG
jgi:hypothetical protein